MGTLQTLDYEIPDSMRRSWQNIVNLLARIADVPTTLIMRVHPEHIEVNTSSETENNPYKVGDKEALGHGLYCEHVIQHSANSWSRMHSKTRNGKTTRISNLV